MRKPSIHLLLIFAALFAWVAYTSHFPFFWDTVQLASKHAHFFYARQLAWMPLPPDIDSGHPPVFGYFLAFLWTVFGKSLLVGHWAMLPFLWGIAGLLYRLGQRISPDKAGVALVLIGFADPVLAGQSALVTPDIPLLFDFLLAVDGLISRRNMQAAVGIVLLCAISMRGMMVTAALLLWIGIAWKWPQKFGAPGRNWALAFVPGLLFAAGFLIWHHCSTGWTGYHPNSPWAPAFARAQGWEFARNILVLGWRWTDLGRFTEWILLGILWWRLRQHGAGFPAVLLNRWSLLFACLVLFLSPSAVLYRNLSAHRYFLPGFAGLHLLTFDLLVRAPLQRPKKVLLGVALLAGLASGNGWIYPSGISMDWDATLAHLPYHRLHADMITYLETAQIDIREVGTAFPNINCGENLRLNGDMRTFAPLNLARCRYALVSNVYNDVSASDFKQLRDHWVLLKARQAGGVWMALYQKKE